MKTISSLSLAISALSITSLLGDPTNPAASQDIDVVVIDDGVVDHDDPYHVPCGGEEWMFTNDDVVPRLVAVSLTNACPGSYILITDPHHDCVGEQRIDMAGPDAASIPLTTVTVCPGGEVSVHCGEGDEDGCDFKLYHVIVAKPEILLKVLQTASGDFTKKDILQSMMQQEPVEITVQPGRQNVPVYLNGSLSEESAEAQAPVSVTVEVINANVNTTLIGDLIGSDDQLMVTDADDLTEDGRIASVGLSVPGGGGIFVDHPGEGGPCTVRVWVHGVTPAH